MEIKRGRYAVYWGKEYTSGRMENGKLILRSTDIKDVEKGFEPCKPFRIKEEIEEIVCLKYVNRTEVESYYHCVTRAIYKGYDFHVIEARENEVSIIATDGDYSVWSKMGMKRIDKYVFQKWVSKEEAEIRIIKEGIIETRSGI